jgi:hypothetical protein
MDRINKIPFSKLKKMVESIENHFVESPERLDEVELTFEYIIGSCFPDVFNNIKEALKEEHTKGYIEGIKACSKDDVNEIEGISG